MIFLLKPHFKRKRETKVKKINFTFLAIAVILLLSACGDEPESPIIQDPQTIQSASSGSDHNTTSSKDDEANADDDSLPPAEGMERSRLTNEWVDADVADTRPLAIIIPNERAALPHYNLSKASVLYEANVEGRMTRLMGIYEDWEDLEKIGNVRSLRLYYGYWALEWDSIIVHWGGPFFINDFLNGPDVENLDGTYDTTGFFRSEDRKDPHNAYVSGEGLKELIQHKGFDLSYRGLAEDCHYQFTSKAEPNTLSQYADAKEASLIDMSGCYPLTRCHFKYNEEDGLYYRYQQLSGSTAGPHMDAATGEQLTFKNILVQYVKHEELGEGYLAFQCHDTTRDGWYFTNGKGIHVTWEKTSDFGATRYYDDTGNEITLNTGKTMIMIVESDDTFHFE